MVTVTSKLGVGLYTLAEAAYYARVRPQTLSRWLYGTKDSEPVLTPRFIDGDERIVTFLDFIQTLAVRAIRVQYKVPLQQIRAAVERAKLEFDVEFPLAMLHSTFLLSDGKREDRGEVVVRLGTRRNLEVWAKGSGTLSIRNVAEPFLDDLHFDSKSGLAEKYCPMRLGKNAIVVDPHVRFGEPFVSPCGHLVQTLFDAIQSEGGIDAAAEEFEVDRGSVALAYRFVDHLKNSSI